MILRLVLVPFGILLAASAATAVLMAISLANPAAWQFFGDLFWHVFDTVAGAALGDAAETERALALARSASKLSLAITVAPSLLIAIVAEAFGLRNFTLQAGGAALLTVLLPALMLPKTAAGGGLPGSLIAILLAAGFCAGGVYWLVAGRSAGARGAPPTA